MSEIEVCVARSPSARRADHLTRVTDLFLRDAPMLSDEQVELFDVVIARLATAIETRARVELAERLAEVPNAPRGVVRSLAHDEIVVARPVLTRSERLSDDDLVAVALAKGRDHMLAISERPSLTEPVTDVLVKRGDRGVVHAVAGNPGACFSRDGVATLLERSRADEALRELLARRDDIGEAELRQILAIAKETARRRVQEERPGAGRPNVDYAIEIGALDVEAAIVPGARNYGPAMAEIEALARIRPLVEGDLAGFAAAGRFEAAICAVARMSDLSLSATERLFEEGDSELLLVVARAGDWSWGTVRELLRLRGAEAAQPHALKRARDAFEKLKPATAQRVLHFLKAREASQKRALEAAADRQMREKVR
ncbi:MAG: DUF2336 domain-containing protein [Salinarimonadaceae bacterium]|nr:MAG: DUF2336 domain-containing protein [Salinarimonadaceae bacterium]